MLKHNLYFTIVFLTCLSPILAYDLYSKFHQRDYRMDFQRLDLIDYNKSVFNIFEVKTFKYNRTIAVWNITINSKVNLGAAKSDVAVQFYKLLSNEYRELPGTNFKLNYCKMIEENLAGLHDMVIRCGNFTTCGVVEETTYKLCNAYPNGFLFPPFLPNGEYKYQIDIIYDNKERLAILAMYVKVYRPIAIPGINKK